MVSNKHVLQWCCRNIKTLYYSTVRTFQNDFHDCTCIIMAHHKYRVCITTKQFYNKWCFNGYWLYAEKIIFLCLILRLTIISFRDNVLLGSRHMTVEWSFWLQTRSTFDCVAHNQSSEHNSFIENKATVWAINNGFW